jgi:hypothetical protein
MKKPWTLRKEEIELLLSHIKNRQEEHGPEQAFRFHHYQRKGSEELSAALYEAAGQNENGAQATQKPRRTKKVLAPRKPAPTLDAGSDRAITPSNTGIAIPAPMDSRTTTPFRTGIATPAPTESTPTLDAGSDRAIMPFNTGIAIPAPTESTMLSPSRTTTPVRTGIATLAPTESTTLTPSPTPAKRHQATSRNARLCGIETGLLYLNQWEMNRLAAQGIKAVAPRNGPNEGDPVYEVPATPHTLAALSAIASNDDQNIHNSEELIDPLLHAPVLRRSSRRRSCQ